MTGTVAAFLVASCVLVARAAVVARRRNAARRRPHTRPAPADLVARLTAPGARPLLAAGLSSAALAVGGLGLGAAAVVASTLGWRFYLRRAEGRRQRAVDSDLPVLLEAVATRLRAGGSLAQAMVEAAPPPGGVLASQWRRTAELVPAVGAVAALDDWARASTRRPVHLAAAALALAGDTGGSPARAVDGVAATVRCRLALADELRALTSQAKASAAVIAAAPVAFGAFAAAADPRTGAFLRTPAGTALLVSGLGLDALGAWWMARLCQGEDG